MIEEKRYKGEIVAERRRNLDFSLEHSKVCIGLTAGLPKYSKKERINYYNKNFTLFVLFFIEKNELEDFNEQTYQNSSRTILFE